MRGILLLFVIALSACGFTPVYYNHGTGSTHQSGASNGLNQIDIAIIPDREGQFLRNALIDRFYRNGYPTAPRYNLRATPINEKITDFDITVDSEATRQQLVLSTNITLIDLKTNRAVLTRTLTATTSNNVLESEFSTIVTEQSAREAALNDLARQIERQLAIFLSK